MDTAELRRLARLYDLEGYLFTEVTTRFRQTGTLEPYDFFAIVIWKSNRAKTKIKQGLTQAGLTVGALMTRISEAPTPAAKVETLLQVWGIGLPMASAILSVCYPQEFTVLDYRAWETLQGMGVAGLPARKPVTVDAYLQYCQVCRAFAAQHKLALRDLDRALWAKSWEEDILKIVENLDTLAISGLASKN